MSLEPFMKVGKIWLPNPGAADHISAADVTAAAVKFPVPGPLPEDPSDTGTRIKHLLDGLRRWPDGYKSPEDLERARQWSAWNAIAENVCFALSHGHVVPKPPKKKKVRRMSSKHSGPRWYDENGKPKPGMPEGAYLRMRTQDDLVWLTEHRPAKNGIDWDQSIKMYGPFVTADEQRAFMCDAWRGATKPGPQRDRAIAQTMAWRRFDE